MADTAERTTNDVIAEVNAWLEESWDPDLTVAEWWERLGTSGWAAPTWPVESYGRGLSRNEGVAVQRAIQQFGALGAPGGLGLLLAGPTIVTHGDEQQRERYLRDIVTGQKAWCQLFSEPGAGSDLAGLNCKAVRDGDEWVVTGQKVWTTMAHQSKWCMLVARTDPDAAKHRGLTYFLMDMDQPGVEIRPLRQITGEAEFNELFIEEARIPHANIVGGENNGWVVAITTLMHERAGLAFALQVEVQIALRELIARAKETGASVDPVVRQRLAQLYVEAQVLRLNAYRGLTATMKRGAPGPEGSLGKWHWAEVNQSLTELALDLAGARAQLADDVWTYRFMRARANSIEGGTTEILKNIVAERVLGLPRAK